jgi:hypothetical protein
LRIIFYKVFESIDEADDFNSCSRL